MLPPKKNAAGRLQSARAPKIKLVQMAMQLMSMEWILRAVARLSVWICRFCISDRKGWNRVLENRKIRIPRTDGNTCAVTASARQETAARPQNIKNECFVPRRLVTAAEHTPSSPKRVATIYKMPMAVLLIPQRVYWSWFKKTVMVGWVSDKSATPAKNNRNVQLRSVLCRVVRKGSGRTASAVRSFTSVKPRDSRTARP